MSQFVSRLPKSLTLHRCRCELLQPEDIEDAVDDDGSRGRKSKSKAKARPTTLTLDQKLDLATSELDATKRDTALKEAAAQRTLSMLEALLEQTELRIEEIKREAYEFKRDVVVGGADERTGEERAPPAQRNAAERNS